MVKKGRLRTFLTKNFFLLNRDGAAAGGTEVPRDHTGKALPDLHPHGKYGSR